jgi:hypothetical protein
MFAIPTFWGLTQTIAGPGIGILCHWPACRSWPCAQLYVKQLRRDAQSPPTPAGAWQGTME